MIKVNADLIEKFIRMYPKWLNPREQQVIEMRYCLNGQSWKTLQQRGYLGSLQRTGKADRKESA